MKPTSKLRKFGHTFTGLSILRVTRSKFMLSTTRDAAAVTRFFRKVLGATHSITPRVITVDKNPAYPKALSTLKEAAFVSEVCELRQIKYLNNIVEQDHRFIKRRENLG